MKTKEQKRKEAIDRLLQALPKEREFMLRCQRGGDIYESTKVLDGEADANAYAAITMADYRKKCRAAGVDVNYIPTN
jgi:hypothetical protein